VRLISAQFVKPFVKSNKNDFVDAEAIAEAVERKNMRFVPIKTDDQCEYKPGGEQRNQEQQQKQTPYEGKSKKLTLTPVTCSYKTRFSLAESSQTISRHLGTDRFLDERLGDLASFQMMRLTAFLRTNPRNGA
jgi:transposase